MNPADFLGNTGELPTIKFKGLDLRVSFPTPVTLTKMSNEIVRWASEEIANLDGVLPAKEVQAMRDKLMLMVSSRQHQYGGQLWNATTSDHQTNSALQLWALVHPNHPSFTYADARELIMTNTDEVRLVLEQVQPSFLELLLSARNVPESLRQEIRKQAGLSSPST